MRLRQRSKPIKRKRSKKNKLVRMQRRPSKRLKNARGSKKIE